MNPSIVTLIEETLSDSRLSGNSPNSCFVTNKAAEELEQCGELALPAIEQAIRERVVPTGKVSAHHHELLSKHRGLMSLWMAYIAIAGHKHRDRALQFMRSVDGPVLATAILSLRATWPYDEGSRIQMPKSLLGFVHDVARNRSGCPAEVANLLVSCLIMPDS